MHRSPFLNARQALKNFRLFESHDLDDTREQITRVLQEHRLIPGKRVGPIRSHMDFFELSKISIGTLKYSNQMNVEVTGLDDYHVLIFCLSGAGVIKTREAEVSINSRWGFVGHAGRGFRARFSNDCEQFIVRVDRDCFPDGVRPCARGLEKIDLTEQRHQGWVRQLQSFVGRFDHPCHGHGDSDASARFERHFIKNLARGHFGEKAESGRALSISPASVRRAERYIRENFRQPIALQDIARAAGVRQRTLHDTFKRFRCASPMQFLRDVRLDQARERLRRISETCSIGIVANQCGFKHFGRFSRDYALRFGETPSRSVRQKRRSDREVSDG